MTVLSYDRRGVPEEGVQFCDECGLRVVQSELTYYMGKYFHRCCFLTKKRREKK